MSHNHHNNHNILRALIRESLLCEEFPEITVGDVKTALKYAKEKGTEEAIKAASKKTGKLGVKTILSLIPGAGAVADAFEAGLHIKDIYDSAMSVSPKMKKINPLWDMLAIDPETSAIVDDGVETEFIKTLGQKVATLPDDEKMPNADEQLRDYLKSKYSNTYITKTK